MDADVSHSVSYVRHSYAAFPLFHLQCFCCRNKYYIVPVSYNANQVTYSKSVDSVALLDKAVVSSFVFIAEEHKNFKKAVQIFF